MNSTTLEPSSEHAIETASRNFSIGFTGMIGFEFLEWEEGRAVLGLDIQERHLNLHGVIHGGVLATLLDVAGACPGTFCPYPGRVRKALTLSMTTTFTGQAGKGQIRAIGTKRAGGSRIYNSSVDIVDADGRLLAFGEGTFRLRGGCEDPYGIAVESR